MLQSARPGACVPSAALEVEAAKELRKSRSIGALKVPGCSCSAPRPDIKKASKCFVPCDPEAMRAATEARLQSLGLVPPRMRLDMRTYIMARNIHSEAGDGATGAEKLVIGEALVNRARESGLTFAQIAMFNGSRFGAQIGRNPAVATARDPFWEDIVAADAVLSGRSGDLGRGATHYFSPAGMDFAKRRGGSRDRFELYDEWTGGSDLMTWVGYVPGIDINRQFLLRKMPKTQAGRAEHARMRPLGRQALAAATPLEILRAPRCGFINDPGRRRIAMASTMMLSAALPAFLIMRYGGRA